MRLKEKSAIPRGDAKDTTNTRVSYMRCHTGKQVWMGFPPTDPHVHVWGFRC